MEPGVPAIAWTESSLARTLTLPVQYHHRYHPHGLLAKSPPKTTRNKCSHTTQNIPAGIHPRAVLCNSTGNVRARVEKRSQSGGDRPDDHRLQVRGR